MNAQEVLKQYQEQLDPEGIHVGVSRQALDETLDLVINLKQMLKRVEWSTQYDYSIGSGCIFCGWWVSYKMDFPLTHGHKPTCPLEKILYDK